MIEMDAIRNKNATKNIGIRMKTKTKGQTITQKTQNNICRVWEIIEFFKPIRFKQAGTRDPRETLVSKQLLLHTFSKRRERLIMTCNLNFQSSHYQYWVLSWRSERISAYPCLSARPYVQQFTGIFHFQRHAGFGRNSVCEVSLPTPSSKSPS